MDTELSTAHLPRQRPRRAALLAGAALASALLLLTGCGLVNGNSDGDTEGSSESDAGEGSGEAGAAPPAEAATLPVRSATTSTEWGSDLEVQVQALERVGDGMLRLTLGVGNHGHEDIDWFWSLDDRDLDTDHSASGTSLLDPQNGTHHLPYTLSGDGTCFCSALEDNGEIEAGVVESLWVVFPAPPDDVAMMTVLTPITPPFFGVPVTDADPVEDPGLEDPRILEVNGETDALVQEYERTETEEEITYELSSDVLFETDSADLSPAAQEVLEEVASEINGSGTSAVSIDGHADDTGDDSVNEPLSLDRAEAVEGVLAELLTGGGVTFDVQGHGSAEPIAGNDTEEGRERNRRVTVTFEK